MKSRSEFNFTDLTNGIKKAYGFAICEVTPTTDGADLKVIKIILKKLIATNPDFEKLEQLAIQNCKVLREEY